MFKSTVNVLTPYSYSYLNMAQKSIILLAFKMEALGTHVQMNREIV